MWNLSKRQEKHCDFEKVFKKQQKFFKKREENEKEKKSFTENNLTNDFPQRKIDFTNLESTDSQFKEGESKYYRYTLEMFEEDEYKSKKQTQRLSIQLSIDEYEDDNNYYYPRKRNFNETGLHTFTKNPKLF